MTPMLLPTLTRQIYSTLLSLVMTLYSAPFELPDDIISSNHIRVVELIEEEVFEALTSLDPNKAMGIGNIHPKILKFCAPILAQPIHHCFCYI